MTALMSTSVSQAALNLRDLECEHLRNPLGIDVTAPRLSWILHDDEALRGLKQTAYHLLVASSPEKLAAGKGGLWDSGRVESDQSVLVPYAGKALASYQDCYWKVRVWGSRGKASAWSEPAH